MLPWPKAWALQARNFCARESLWQGRCALGSQRSWARCRRPGKGIPVDHNRLTVYTIMLLLLRGQDTLSVLLILEFLVFLLDSLLVLQPGKEKARRFELHHRGIAPPKLDFPAPAS